MKNAANEPYPLLSSGNDIQEEKLLQTSLQHKTENENDEDKSNSSCSNQPVEDEEEEVSPREEFKLAHFLKGWLSYSRLWGGSRKGSPTQNSRPSRFRTPLLGSGPKLIELQG